MHLYDERFCLVFKMSFRTLFTFEADIDVFYSIVDMIHNRYKTGFSVQSANDAKGMYSIGYHYV